MTASGSHNGAKKSKKRKPRHSKGPGKPRPSKGSDKPRTGREKKPPRKPKEVKSYKQNAKRTNLPTDQTGRTMNSKDAEPIPYTPSNPNDNLPKDLRPPRLCWERDSEDSTSAGPLYIHEKLHPAAFAESLKRTHVHKLDSFFGLYDGLPKGAEFEWYQHRGHWQNRIIRGESRRVMASLLAKEAMAGKVQMIFFDPPYGIDFRNILQANVDKDLDYAEMPNDPEALQTFRDIYKNGIHSYLDNIRSISAHARDLLSDQGSFFMQIGSANIHLSSVVLDEVFGAENRVATITFSKSGTSSSKTLPEVTDYLLWYAKEKSKMKYYDLYEPLENRKDILAHMSYAAKIETPSGENRNLTKDEKIDPDRYIPEGFRLYSQVQLTSQHEALGRSDPYVYDDKTFPCPQGRQWSVSSEGMDRLAEMNRLDGDGRSLRWKQYENELPGKKINNMWARQLSADDLHYVVETSEHVVARCMMMTTDPGDLVLDPTCGSGTTAYVAEKWGRRWITSDMGLVAVNLARQRIIMGVFPWYLLIDSEKGHKRENEIRKHTFQNALPHNSSYDDDPLQGFVYERMRHVSPEILAYPDREAKIDYMMDKPEEDRDRLRVSSPFTIESLSPYRYVDPNSRNPDGPTTTHQNLVSALREAGIRVGSSNVSLEDLEDYPGKMITHTATFNGRRACLLVANDDCTVPPVMVDHAVEEAAKMPSVNDLIVVAFAYEPSVVNERRGRITIHKTMANLDLQVGNLQNKKDDIAFVRVGEPDIKISFEGDKIIAEVMGYDTFDPTSGNTRPGTKDDVYCWLIDTDYDGRSFFARRVHFPGSDKDRQIKQFHKKLERHIDQDLWDSTFSLTSAPFKVPKSGRIAVKIITSTHSEMTAVIDVSPEASRPRTGAATSP